MTYLNELYAAFFTGGQNMRGKEEIKKTIEEGKAVLGIEFGSTRIKAVLIDEDKSPIASGSYDWENQLVDNVWTYSMEKIQNGLQGCYQDLVKDVEAKYDVKLTKFAALGVSAMMHGYLAFDENDKLLVPFRTWRNTITEEASEKLTELFSYHIPQRWSIAHLYQAILNGEEHVKDVRYITTLAGYIHWKLTGKKVLGNGDAAGMFPIDIATKKFNEKMMDQFDELTAEKNFPWKIREILPEVLVAGEDSRCIDRRRQQNCLILQEHFSPEFQCVLRKEMPEQEWLQQTALLSAQEMYLPEQVYLQWQYLRKT